MNVSSHDHVVSPFEAERERLWRLAYRMLGIAADADDVVQDTWLRWQTVDRNGIDNPAAWLTTVSSRLSLDRLRSAQRQRESYVGPWLPEPIETELVVGPLGGSGPGSVGIDPADAAILAESISLGFLAVMERLGPVERAVFLLHDVFRVPFDEVGAIVDRSPAAARQIAVRARRRIEAERPRYAPDPADVEQMAEAFLIAAASGDQALLSELLVDDVVLVSDGGGKARAARHPIVGADRVSRFLVGVAGRASESHAVHPASANGNFAVYITEDDEPDSVLVFNWTMPDDGQTDSTWTAPEATDSSGAPLVDRIFVMRNPDKLAGFAARWKAANHT